MVKALHGSISNTTYAQHSTREKWADLVEVALIHGLCNVADLAALVSFPFLFIELFSQRLQFSQGHLQGQTVCMTHRCVLQHVLMKSSMNKVNERSCTTLTESTLNLNMLYSSIFHVHIAHTLMINEDLVFSV